MNIDELEKLIAKRAKACKNENILTNNKRVGLCFGEYTNCGFLCHIHSSDIPFSLSKQVKELVLNYYQEEIKQLTKEIEEFYKEGNNG